MLKVVPIVKPNRPHERANSTEKLAMSKQEHAHNPSFGFKPIELDKAGKTAKFFVKVDENFDSAWQRLISGITAILTQPFFDLNNKDADEETRRTSCARTIGKIIAGTATGVAIRWGCIKLFENFTRNKNTEQHLIDIGKANKAKTKLGKWDQILLPEKMLNSATFREIKKYRGALGTFAALGIMLFTNFLIDAPLTMYLTNKITPKLTRKSPQDKAEGGEK